GRGGMRGSRRIRRCRCRSRLSTSSPGATPCSLPLSRQPSARFPAMAQVLPAERDLRRVIGDADGVGDREVDGLGEQELLDLYRSMVLLRTYDERSVVYHRQGRIGTYAIFWNHEAMQAGAVHALEDEGWHFPSHRDCAHGLLGGMPPA